MENWKDKQAAMSEQPTARLEELLRQRAALPVADAEARAALLQRRIECRQQARQWLAANGGPRALRNPGRHKRSHPQWAAPGLEPRAWALPGIALAGALVGYGLLSIAPPLQPLPWLAGIGGLSSALSALLALAALGITQWPSLRSLLRA